MGAGDPGAVRSAAATVSTYQRGGAYTVTRTAGVTRIEYHNTRFTGDVAVSGAVTLDASSALTGLVTATAPGGRTGTLTVSATLWDPAHPQASLHGTLGARDIAVLTPAR
jgi:hypothetical protein